MPIKPVEATGMQLGRLAKAQAITVEQVDLAMDIVATKFRGIDPDTQVMAAVGVLQALATNYAAQVDASKA